MKPEPHPECATVKSQCHGSISGMYLEDPGLGRIASLGVYALNTSMKHGYLEASRSLMIMLLFRGAVQR